MAPPPHSDVPLLFWSPGVEQHFELRGKGESRCHRDEARMSVSTGLATKAEGKRGMAESNS